MSGWKTIGLSWKEANSKTDSPQRAQGREGENFIADKAEAAKDFSKSRIYVLLLFAVLPSVLLW